jgi:L-fucose isomerase-like protein
MLRDHSENHVAMAIGHYRTCIKTIKTGGSTNKVFERHAVDALIPGSRSPVGRLWAMVEGAKDQG